MDMTCSSCEVAVRKALENVEGDNEITFSNLANKT